jgi:hypothetical protein
MWPSPDWGGCRNGKTPSTVIQAVDQQRQSAGTRERWRAPEGERDLASTFLGCDRGQQIPHPGEECVSISQPSFAFTHPPADPGSPCPFPCSEAQPSPNPPAVPVASTSTSAPPELEEMAPLRRPFLSVTPSYGSMGSASRASGSISPKLDRVPEERPATFISLEDVEEEVELDLEDQGYFLGKQIQSQSLVLLQRTSSRLISTLDSLVHVRSADISLHLAPTRHLHPPRIHP